MRAAPSLWEDLELPVDVSTDKGPFERWIEGAFPSDDEHDFVLWSDGSGCRWGWGGYACVFRENASGLHDVRFGGTFGETVRRCEFRALLAGLHGIMDYRLRDIESHGAYEGDKPIDELSGNGKITVAWYTDRRELALSLIYREGGGPVYDRKKDKDLWAQFMFFQRYFCITPRPIDRNSVTEQSLCDSLCGTARHSLKLVGEPFQTITQEQLPSEIWLPKQSRPQDAKL